MIEKQTVHEARHESEKPAKPAQHIPVPKESAGVPDDPEVIERLRSCH
jgi:hypothetical protein